MGHPQNLLIFWPPFCSHFELPPFNLTSYTFEATPSSPQSGSHISFLQWIFLNFFSIWLACLTCDIIESSVSGVVVVGFVQGGAVSGFSLDNLKCYIVPSRDPALPQGKPLPEWGQISQIQSQPQPSSKTWCTTLNFPVSIYNLEWGASSLSTLTVSRLKSELEKNHLQDEGPTSAFDYCCLCGYWSRGAHVPHGQGRHCSCDSLRGRTRRLSHRL